IQKISATLCSSAQSLLQSPAPDMFVVAAKQHLRNIFTRIRNRSRVVRAIEQTVSKGILYCRIRMAQRAKQKSYYGIHQHHDRQLAAGQHIVSNGPFFIDVRLDKSL